MLVEFKLDICFYLTSERAADRFDTTGRLRLCCWEDKTEGIRECRLHDDVRRILLLQDPDTNVMPICCNLRHFDDRRVPLFRGCTCSLLSADRHSIDTRRPYKAVAKLKVYAPFDFVLGSVEFCSVHLLYCNNCT